MHIPPSLHKNYEWSWFRYTPQITGRQEGWGRGDRWADECLPTSSAHITP